MTDEYTRGDRVIATGTAIWTIVWKVAAVVIIAWNLVFWRWSDKTWCRWSFFQWVICEGLFGVIATTWFTIGGIRDIIDLFRTIRTIKPDNTDNGMVASEAEQAPPGRGEEKLAELLASASIPRSRWKSKDDELVRGMENEYEQILSNSCWPFQHCALDCDCAAPPQSRRRHRDLMRFVRYRRLTASGCIGQRLWSATRRPQPAPFTIGLLEQPSGIKAWISGATIAGESSARPISRQPGQPSAGYRL